MTVSHGGGIDEIPGPGHPEGNQHTGGSPNRHPNSSISACGRNSHKPESPVSDEGSTNVLYLG